LFCLQKKKRMCLYCRMRVIYCLTLCAFLIILWYIEQCVRNRKHILLTENFQTLPTINIVPYATFSSKRIWKYEIGTDMSLISIHDDLLNANTNNIRDFHYNNVYYVNIGYGSTTSTSNTLITLSTDRNHSRLDQSKIVQYFVPFLDYHIILYNDGLLYDKNGVKYQPAPVFTNYNETIMKIDYCLGDCLWVLTNYHYVYKWDFKTNVLSLVSEQHEIVSIYGDRFDSSVYMISSENKLFLGDTSGLVSWFPSWNFIDVIRNGLNTILRRRDGEIYINGITQVKKSSSRFTNSGGPIAMTSSEILMTETVSSGSEKCLVKYDITLSANNDEVQLDNRIEYPELKDIGNIMVLKDSTGKDVVVFTSTHSDIQCGTNQYRDEISFVCMPCDDHRHNTDGGECNLCPAGTERFTGYTTCTPCDAISSSATGTACSRCPLNSVQDSDDPSQCSQCPAGTERKASDLRCVPCDAISSSTRGTACSRCPLNSVQDSDDPSQCSQCPAGTERKASDTTCTPCDAGYGSTAGSSCTLLCERHEYYPEWAPGYCVECDEHQYREINENSCKDCPASRPYRGPGKKFCTSLIPVGSPCTHYSQCKSGLCGGGYWKKCLCKKAFHCGMGEDGYVHIGEYAYMNDYGMVEDYDYEYIFGENI